MNRRDVAALLTGSVGLAAIAMAAALTSAGAPNTPAPDVAIHRTARVLHHSHKQPVDEEGTVEPSVLYVPTITIFGEVPRRIADLPRPRKDDARKMAAASP